MSKNLTRNSQGIPIIQLREKGRIIEIFPQEILDLQEELSHPEHQEFMRSIGNAEDVGDFETRLAHVAAYCEVVLNDWYSHDDILYLCSKLVNRLKAKRGGIFIVNSIDSIN